MDSPHKGMARLGWPLVFGLLTLTAGSSLATPPPAEKGDQPLTAVFPERFPPIFMVTKNGVPTGLGIEAMEAIAERAGLDIQYRSTDSWPAALAQVEEGRAELIPNVGVTARRERYLAFSDPLFAFKVSLFVRTGRARELQSLQALTEGGHLVGVVEKNVAAQLLGSRPDLELRSFHSVADALVALYSGKIDALAYPEPIIRRLTRTFGSRKEITVVGEPLATIDRVVGVRKDRRAILEPINRAIGELKASGRMETLYHRWYGPPEPYWNARRLSIAFLIVLAVVLAGGLYWRLRVLTRLNRQLARADNYNRAVLDAAQEGIITVDRLGQILSVNRAACRLFSPDNCDVTGQNLAELLSFGRSTSHENPQELLTSTAHPAHGIHVMGVRTDGTQFPSRINIAPHDTPNGPIYVCTVYDLTAEQQAEDAAAHAADHDPVTGLLNERGTRLVLDELLSYAERAQRPLACINLGIQHFDHINNLYGRRTGDDLLAKMGHLLEETVRDSDVVGQKSTAPLVARSEGAGFLLALPDTDTAGAQALAKRLLQRFAEATFHAASDDIHLNFKAGIAGYPEHDGGADALISHAETALYQIKTAPAEQISIYDPSALDQQTQDQYWIEELHAALNENRLALHYQPILHTATGQIHQQEVLVRLHDRNDELVLPGRFIEIAERFGLITDIDRRVVQLALDQLVATSGHGTDLCLAVNLSGVHMASSSFFAWLSQQLETRRDLDPARLIFEVTESAAIQNILQARYFMETLSALGCRFAIDDFGSGFSSFAYLRQLPAHIVKIDGSLIRNLAQNEEDVALVRAITDVAHSLGKEVVAEWVEDQAVFDQLTQIGVDYMQGFWIGRPQPSLNPNRR